MSDAIPHRWDLSREEAVTLQNRLAASVDVTTPLDLESISHVAGVDVSVKDGISRAAIVVMTFPTLEEVDTVTARAPTPFPYITGLLSFREGAVILEAWEKLHTLPDVAIFDGQGYAHPRRVGIATHMGLWLQVPTVGCGKTRLVGTHGDLAAEKGSRQPLVHKGEQVGILLRTRTNVKPVYISAGHRATHTTAADLVLACAPKYRLPEPIRAAHNLAGDF